MQLDITRHTQLPTATQSPPWEPEDLPYTEKDKQCPYPSRIHSALSRPTNAKLIQWIEESFRIPLY